MVSQCGADAWLNGLASGDQRRLMGSGSALAMRSRQCTIQIAAFTLLFLCYTTRSHAQKKISYTISLPTHPIRQSHVTQTPSYAQEESANH